VFIGLACVLFALYANAMDGPVFPKGKGDACVADTDYMRANHMDLLLHQRDETVLEGIRDKPFSLVGCVDCHASADENGDMQRVDAEGQFCQSCHTYAAVKIDCFGCHAAVPENNDTAQIQLELLRMRSSQTDQARINKTQSHNDINIGSNTSGSIASGPIAKLYGLDQHHSR